jgi:hypothetical protein
MEVQNRERNERDQSRSVEMMRFDHAEEEFASILIASFIPLATARGSVSDNHDY